MKRRKFFGKEVKSFGEYLDHVEERIEEFGEHQTTLSIVKKAIILDRGRKSSRGSGIKNSVKFLRKECEERNINVNKVDNWVILSRNV